MDLNHEHSLMSHIRQVLVRGISYLAGKSSATETTPKSTRPFRHSNSSGHSSTALNGHSTNNRTYSWNKNLSKAITTKRKTLYIRFILICALLSAVHQTMCPQTASSQRPPANLGNNTGGFQAAWERHQPSPLNDATTRHPVFFTDRLRRSPLAGPAAPSPLNNPVAHGYAYQETPRNPSGPRL